MTKKTNKPSNFTYASFSFGCRVNQAEIEVINSRLSEAGFIYNEAKPDIYIINTCAVTNKAEREARQHIYQVKRRFPNVWLVVTGCSATYWNKNNQFSDLPIDLLVNNKNKENLVAILKSSKLQPPLSHLVGGHGQMSDKYIKSNRVFIKIQDGCHRFCTYCIVSFLRGLPKSAPIDKIISHINSLNNNIKEVILTAINTEAYGKDTGENFIDLLKNAIDKTVIPRISIGSIHPWSVDKDFFKFYQNYKDRKRLINFFHIPLQSGSDKVLELMKRGYKSSEFMEKLHILQQINSYALIATDVIVGFLGEDQKEFENTYNFLKKSPISKFHIFKYSKRAGTAADYLSRRTKEPDFKYKSERAKRLKKLGEEKYAKFVKSLIGLSSTALFLENKNKEYQKALLENQVPLWIKTTKNLNGEIRNIKIESYKNSLLFGKII